MFGNICLRRSSYVHPEILALLASAEPEPSNWALSRPWKNKDTPKCENMLENHRFARLFSQRGSTLSTIRNVAHALEPWGCFAPVDRGRCDIPPGIGPPEKDFGNGIPQIVFREQYFGNRTPGIGFREWDLGNVNEGIESRE